MPRCTILIGPPGSGKSTWRETYLLENPDTVVISQDDLVDAWAEANGKTYTEAFREAPIKAFARQNLDEWGRACDLRRDVLLDRTNMSAKSRGKFLAHVAGKHYVKVAVCFDTHPWVLEDRLVERAQRTGKFIPTHVVKNMLAAFETPQWPEFDQNIIVYSGPPDLGVTVRTVKRRLKRWFGQLVKGR